MCYHIFVKNGHYELVVAPDGYPGKRYRGRYCYEHHLVYWQVTGTLPSKSECLHHINDNKRDNRFENLELMTISDHSSGHAPRASMSKLTCAYCGKKFVRATKDVKHAKNNLGQTDFYCDRVCMAKHFGRGRPKTIPDSSAAE